jgi:hypothetical protein
MQPHYIAEAHMLCSTMLHTITPTKRKKEDTAKILTAHILQLTSMTPLHVQSCISLAYHSKSHAFHLYIKPKSNSFTFIILRAKAKSKRKNTLGCEHFERGP